MEHLERDDVLSTVDRMVEELLARGEVEGPPVDTIALAQKSLGMVICLDSRQSQRGRAQRAGGQRQICLRPEPREERHQWTVAHEIGEHLKPELLNRLGLEPGQTKAMAGESLANLFAHRLLVPTGWFRHDATSLDFDLLALKDKYKSASHEVIAWRWLDLPSPCIVTVVDNGKIHRRRSNAWPTRRELSEAEVKCQRTVNQTGKPQRFRLGEWTVHGWPVHQADWKREVLRSVIDD